jgi:uncharacterized protein (TIGR02453 family)
MKYDMAQVLDFLREIKQNNNTEWFHAHKAEYERARNTFKDLSQEILTKMQVIDPLLRGLQLKDCIFRFNRDTRFSADKAPYKRHFGVYLVPGGKKVVGAGYYLHIQPLDNADEMFGQSLVDAGIYMPPSKAAKIIREEIYYGGGKQLEDFLAQKAVKETYTLDNADPLKVLPKNLKDSPYDHLIRMRNWDMSRNLSDEEVLEDDFVERVVDMFALAKPWNDFFNTVLDGAEFESAF